jgi:hypothetical protein
MRRFRETVELSPSLRGHLLKRHLHLIEYLTFQGSEKGVDPAHVA